MSQEPLSFFGALYNVCIREDRSEQRKLLTEGFVFLLLGAASSVLTTYVLAYLGVLV